MSLGMHFGGNISTVPDYTFTLPYETALDRKEMMSMFINYHYISTYIAIVYLALVFGGQQYMKNRRAFQFDNALFIWNVFLAVFSITGAVRTVPELLYTMGNFGFQGTICSRSFFADNSVTVFWTVMFLLSKIVELVDTAFVVLRKKNLMFLHWFHHCTVLVWSWYLAGDLVAMGRWFMTMNYTVHSVMYTYYALRAMNVRVPKNIAMSITSAQVVQMLVGFFISTRTFYSWLIADDCAITARIAILSVTLYSFYFALFASFFYKSYVVKKSLRKTE